MQGASVLTADTGLNPHSASTLRVVWQSGLNYMELHSKPHASSILFLSLLYYWQSREAIGGKGTRKYETSFYQHLKKLDPGTSKVYQEPAGQWSASERDPLPVAMQHNI